MASELYDVVEQTVAVKLYIASVACELYDVVEQTVAVKLHIASVACDTVEHKIV